MPEYNSTINFRKRVKPLAEPISEQEIFELGKTLEKPQDRALFYFLYLTGARISEALQVQCRDLSPKDVDLPSGDTIRCIAVNLITLKRRSGMPRRTLFINLVGLDLEMFKIINAHLITHRNLDEFLFNYGDVTRGTDKARVNAYWKVNKINYSIRGVAPPDGRIVLLPNFRFFCHYLRHCRLTHLSQVYGFNSRELQLFTGWTRSDIADIYTNLMPNELIYRLVERDGGKPIST